MISRESLQEKFKVFILLSLFVLVMELAGGFFTNSLALLSDAGHVLIDLLAFLLTYASMKIAGRRATKKFTYGYYRAEIFAAAINGAILVLITAYIFYSAYQRFLAPQPIKAPEMLAVSIIGLLANLYVVIRMQGHEHNLNVRSAYLHVLSDMLSSVGVVIAGALILFTGNYLFDPLVSALIGLFILANSVNLIREAMHVLMEATPKHVDLEKLASDMKRIRHVKQVHDLHVWSISSDEYALSAHVLIDVKNVKSMNKIISSINKMVKKKYRIEHSTIQSECERCVEGKNTHAH